MSTDIEQAPARITPREAIRQVVDRNMAAIGASLPTGYSQERFARLLLTAANTNPELFECDPRSFLAAGITAAQLGLEPNDPRGLAYLIPFKDGRRATKVVQLIIGYQGLLDLARRSGKVTAIQVHPVYKADTFARRIDEHGDHVTHGPCRSPQRPEDMTAVWASAKVSGDPQVVVLERWEIDQVRDKFAKGERSPWKTDYVEMAKKTALRRLCKLLPLTVEIAHAEMIDERPLAVVNDDLTIPAEALYESDTLEAEATDG